MDIWSPFYQDTPLGDKHDTTSHNQSDFRSALIASIEADDIEGLARLVFFISDTFSVIGMLSPRLDVTWYEAFRKGAVSHNEDEERRIRNILKDIANEYPGIRNRIGYFLLIAATRGTTESYQSSMTFAKNLQTMFPDSPIGYMYEYVTLAANSSDDCIKAFKKAQEKSSNWEGLYLCPIADPRLNGSKLIEYYESGFALNGNTIFKLLIARAYEKSNMHDLARQIRKNLIEKSTDIDTIRIAKEESSNSCFIMTTVFGDKYSDEVEFYRRIRDNNLAKYKVGAKIISLYYKCGPIAADYIAEQVVLRKVLRFAFHIPIMIQKRYHSTVLRFAQLSQH